MSVTSAIVELLEELERISRTHEEVTDTDVRESLHLVLNHHFVWGRTRTRALQSVGMFSRDGDQLVLQALEKFLDVTEASNETRGLLPGQQRLDLLQSTQSRTRTGKRYDEFIGHRDTPLPPEALPEHMFFQCEEDD